ncbi:MULTISPECIES: sugar ABC transporter permease [Microbacterium]|uniref:carbohydrate ABC transporter permease n=1 Tax=Microbacterium TaxID=33882 RepID=UPI00146A7B7D|nr:MULTISPECIES: sugar ABC transporter permease [Microbacterium]
MALPGAALATPVKQKEWSPAFRGRRSNLAPYAFLAPFAALFVTFTLVPVGYAIVLSLLVKERIPGQPASDVFGGFANYLRAFTDPDFLTSFSNILILLVVQVPIMLGLATGLALTLDLLTDRFRAFIQSVALVPYIVPGVIAGLLWGYLYSTNLSPANALLEALGAEPIAFISPELILFSIGNIVTWAWTGYNMVILYAGLQTIPREVYEAADVDGASTWQKIRHIKLPLLRPSLVVCLVFTIIGTTQIFAEPFVLSPLGYVPENVTPNYYLYGVALRDGNYSYGAAIAVIIAMVTFLVSLAFLRRTASGSGAR